MTFPVDASANIVDISDIYSESDIKINKFNKIRKSIRNFNCYTIDLINYLRIINNLMSLNLKNKDKE